ncbi:hypothetical protein CYMTET_21116 [Cymbomonas tetramitiformis]|uniref:Uncharacterized protein n=1 Tax=Cymbomonas tetramitiformis TaxID=36881 RepID=A0AAE0G2T1_9CHLO|nr:hypothetical protein CYMTET_21116 [Cymbomonas tetramitiformis]
MGDDKGGTITAALYEENVANVDAIYAKGRHRQWAKAIRELALGGKDVYFEAVKDQGRYIIWTWFGPKAQILSARIRAGQSGQDIFPVKDTDRLAKIVVILKTEFGSAGLNLTSFDFDDLSKAVIEKRLARDNRAVDWTPSEEARKYKILERLDSDLYAAVMGTLTARLAEKIESALKYQRLGGASAAPPKNRRGKGLDGYRAGSHPTPQVGFDKQEMRALPLCNRCGREGVGKKYHEYKNCPFGGKGAVGGSAAYCMPIDNADAPEAMHALALCHIFQVAADAGAEAFAAAVQEYAAPAVLTGSLVGLRPIRS